MLHCAGHGNYAWSRKINILMKSSSLKSAVLKAYPKGNL